MKNVRNLVSRNLLVVFVIAMMSPVMALASDAVSPKDSFAKAEKSFSVLVGSEHLTKDGKEFSVTRFYDPEKKVTCYVTSAGSISCMHLGETPLSDFRAKFEAAKETAVANPAPENIAAYKKLDKEMKRKALEFTNAMHKAGFIDYAEQLPQPARALIDSK